jgi:hypothetical protein
MFEVLMDSRFDREIQFLLHLMSAKRILSPWITFGRAMRPVQFRKTEWKLQSNQPTLVDDPEKNLPDTTLNRVKFHYESILSSTWLNVDSSALLVLFVSVRRDYTHTVEFSIDTNRYGIPVLSHQMCVLSQVFCNKSVIRENLENENYFGFSSAFSGVSDGRDFIHPSLSQFTIHLLSIGKASHRFAYRKKDIRFFCYLAKYYLISTNTNAVAVVHLFKVYNK